MDVPIGVSVGEMIEKAGGIDGVYGEIIMGGAFTGKSTDLDAPTTKTTGGISHEKENFRIFTVQMWESLSVHAAEAKSVCVRSLPR